ncbi:hypothetical protein A8135_13730 [Legionella jamestowniensis]|uniref:EpsG family protein n=2 Tax=Legionella jamestowniensis TaxID=455 RepID=A0ABX2XSG3_9GAMM|nr:hypothetical protein A8135_13730 [Legionella jamestowniensis]
MKISTPPLYAFFLILPIIILLSLAVGFRPSEIGSDTINYIKYYNAIGLFYFEAPFEFLFNLVATLFFSFDCPVGVFFTCLSVINFIIIGFISNRITYYIGYRIFWVLMIFLNLSPFFLNVQTNVIRQGTATLSLLLFYILLLTRSKSLNLILVALLATGFHKSTIIFILCSILTLFSYQTVFRSVFFLAALYTSNIMTRIIFLVSKYLPVDLYGIISSYGRNTGYKIGNRLDFVIFTFTAGAFFYYMSKYFLNSIDREKFLQLVKIYWILTIPFFLLGFGAYADRYLLPAWLYLSILSAVLLVLAFRRDFPTKTVYSSLLLSSVLFCFLVQGIF